MATDHGYGNAISITPSDATDLSTPVRALLCGGAGGTCKVDMVGVGTGITLTLFQGIVVPAHVTKVYFTGTAATAIVGLY